MYNKKFKCVKVVFSDYANEIGYLRRKSWETVEGFNPKAFPAKEWIDELDKSAIHWAVFQEQKIIACARLGFYYSFEETPYMDMMKQYKSQLKLPIASLNRLVVCKDYRRSHISLLLDDIRIEEAKKNGIKTIVGQAVSSRIKSLQNFGFEYIADIGSITELPNIELSLMIKQL